MDVRIRSAAVLLILCFVVAACARVNGARAGETSSPPPDEGTSPLPSDMINNPMGGTNWDNPIGGTPVQSISDAQAAMPFQIVGAQVLGAPSDIVVAGQEQVAFAYDTTAYGRVDLAEGATQMSDSQWLAAAQQIVADTGQPGYNGSAEILDLSDGASALVTTSPDGSHSTAEWVHGGVNFGVFGPTIQKQAVESIAGQIADTESPSPSPTASAT